MRDPSKTKRKTTKEILRTQTETTNKRCISCTNFLTYIDVYFDGSKCVMCKAKQKNNGN